MGEKDLWIILGKIGTKQLQNANSFHVNNQQFEKSKFNGSNLCEK